MCPSLQVGGGDGSVMPAALPLGTVSDFGVPHLPTVGTGDSFRHPQVLPADVGADVNAGAMARRTRVMRNSAHAVPSVSSARRWVLCGRPVVLPPNLALNRTRRHAACCSATSVAARRLAWFR